MSLVFQVLAKYKNIIKSLIQKGFFHIFGANMMSKSIFMISSIFLVRVLDVDTYGFWSYAFNIFTIITLLQGAGSNVGILQYCSKEPDPQRTRRFFALGNRVSFWANLIILFISLFFLYVFEFKIPNTSTVVAILTTSIFFLSLAENYKSYYRARLLNKEFAYSEMFFALYRTTSMLVLGYYFSLTGLVISQISSYVLNYLLCRSLDKEYVKDLSKLEVSEEKDFIKFSVIASGNNMISRFLYLIDTFLIGQILVNTALVAHYKTASILPSNLIFIPQSIILYIYPFIRKNASDLNYVKRKYLDVVLKLAIINLSITVVLFIYAPFVVRILFSEKYIESIPALRVLLIGFFFAGTFRIPAGNFIAAIHKLKVNVIVTSISGVLNIVLDYVFIVKYGIYGAAYATTIVFILNSLMSNGYLIYYFKKGKHESTLSE